MDFVGFIELCHSLIQFWLSFTYIDAAMNWFWHSSLDCSTCAGLGKRCRRCSKWLSCSLGIRNMGESRMSVDVDTFADHSQRGF